MVPLALLKKKEQKQLQKEKKEEDKMKKKRIVAPIAVVTLLLVVTTTIESVESQLGKGETESTSLGVHHTGIDRQAPSVVSGDNIYIAWWTNNTANGNDEVMFRASTDGGATFGDKINLSNTTDSESTRVEIAGESENVVVSWWETNQTSDIPVARISTDAGETFGPMIMLAANGTISGTEEEGEGET
jgi:hypothetical protein